MKPRHFFTVSCKAGPQTESTVISMLSYFTNLLFKYICEISMFNWISSWPKRAVQGWNGSRGTLGSLSCRSVFRYFAFCWKSRWTVGWTASWMRKQVKWGIGCVSLVTIFAPWEFLALWVVPLWRLRGGGYASRRCKRTWCARQRRSCGPPPASLLRPWRCCIWQCDAPHQVRSGGENMYKPLLCCHFDLFWSCRQFGDVFLYYTFLLAALAHMAYDAPKPLCCIKASLATCLAPCKTHTRHPGSKIKKAFWKST